MVQQGRDQPIAALTAHFLLDSDDTTLGR